MRAIQNPIMDDTNCSTTASVDNAAIGAIVEKVSRAAHANHNFGALNIF